MILHELQHRHLSPGHNHKYTNLLPQLSPEQAIMFDHPSEKTQPAKKGGNVVNHLHWECQDCMGTGKFVSHLQVTCKLPASNLRIFENICK